MLFWKIGIERIIVRIVPRKLEKRGRKRRGVVVCRLKEIRRRDNWGKKYGKVDEMGEYYHVTYV